MNALDELRQLTAHAVNRRTETGIPRVAMVQGRVAEHELTAVYDPMINVILQGAKTMTIGDRSLHYNPATYFVMSVELPAVGTLHSVSGKPYLAVSLSLDARILAEVLERAPAGSGRGAGFDVAPMTESLFDAWLRLLRLMKTPDEIPALAPLYEREILFRVLQGPQGHLLRGIAVPDSAAARIRLAIDSIRRHFDRPIRMPSLARQAGMSEAAFRRHFHATTAMSPLQFQKRLRLMQARRLLLEQANTASNVAFEVGYESPTQFTREYARFFGKPPASDARALREKLGIDAGARHARS